MVQSFVTSNRKSVDMSIEIVIDLETTVQRLETNIVDNSPFNPKNKIVSAHWRLIEDDILGEPKRAVFHHKEKETPDRPSELIQDLNKASKLIAHNAKFDLLYLLEANFSIPKKVHCTMIGEYLLARGQHIDKSLKGTASRRKVQEKKSDLVDDLFKKGTGFEAMPLDTVIEYADADVLACGQIYLQQKEEMGSLQSVLDLSNDMLLFLCEMERNGIRIDLDELERVELDYLKEKESIEKKLNFIVSDVMGDTPINLNSGIDMTQVVYSRVVKDRELHKATFNIGVDARGKTLYAPRMSANKFANAVRNTTRVVKKTIAHQCPNCKGKGFYQKYKKNGEPYIRTTTCKNCDGTGVLLKNTTSTAGLKLVPEGPIYASINGFKTDKNTIKKLIIQAKEKNNTQAVEFLEGITRLNAITTYLDSFVKGIQTWTRHDGILHANFNQTTTRTGRLSSSNPNFQNQPKGSKFPVRRCVVSRFNKGHIIEIDYSGLEFRVAGELSKDPQIIEDITNGKDVHKQTAAIINQCDESKITKDLRQQAKAYTFAPLYGGLGMSEPEHIRNYFKEYFNIYKGLKEWHRELVDTVMSEGYIKTPSGREFAFPNAQRLHGGRISNQTAVVNYPVQSFATADIVPLSCVRTLRKFQEKNLKSKIILTVHDSIVVDCHPEEFDEVINILVWAMSHIEEEMIERFNYKPLLPLDIEISYGKDWLNNQELALDLYT